MKNKTILKNIQMAGDFNVFLDLLGKIRLARTLDKEYKFTVFAPPDNAFQEIPKSEFEKIIKNKERLARILKYHILSKKNMSYEIKKMRSIKTLSGRHIDIHIRNRKISLNGAKIKKADIECSNGVIHIIDSVMMP